LPDTLEAAGVASTLLVCVVASAQVALSLDVQAVSDVSEHCGAMATNPFPTLPSCYDLSLAVGAMDMMGSPSDVGMGMPDTLQVTLAKKRCRSVLFEASGS
jgi:hypothetical protein